MSITMRSEDITSCTQARAGSGLAATTRPQNVPLGEEPHRPVVVRHQEGIDAWSVNSATASSTATTVLDA
jgi:hypothetical protein